MSDMKLEQIYSKYQIPPNVVRHQREVAAVGRYVCEHWLGEKLNCELIVKTLLLHDMGNIIKFKKPFLGEVAENREFWEDVQAQFIALYGSDVHLATMTIVRELGQHEVANLIDSMREVWVNPEFMPSLEARVCEFADCCVTPTGITTFENRLADLKLRYGYKDDSEALLAAKENANFIASQLSVALESIAIYDFSESLERMKDYSL